MTERKIIRKVWRLINKLVREEEGTEVVEWALVAGLVIIAAAGAWLVIGGNVSTVMGNLETKTGNAATASGT